MPATLRELKGIVAQVDVFLGDPDTPEAERDFDRDYITVWYKQHAYTSEIEELASKADHDGRPSKALATVCAAAFTKWTLKRGAPDELADELDDAHARGDAKKITALEAEIARITAEQEPIPITTESLTEIPTSILMAILEAIGESRRPNTNGTEPHSRKR